MINTSIHQNKCTVEYYAFIREETLTYARTWMNFEKLMLSEISQSINKISFNLYGGIQSNQIHRRDNHFNRYGDSFKIKKSSVGGCWHW